MNNTPDLLSPVVTPDSNQLAQAVETLRRQFQTTLIILIILSGAINLYLLRQFTTLRKEIAVVEPQVKKMASDFERVTRPLMNSFLKQLTDYAQTHPDFRPLLAKYNIKARRRARGQPHPFPPQTHHRPRSRPRSK